MKTIGLIFVVLALIIGVVPQLTNCSEFGRSLKLANGQTTPMKCYWTAQAELAVAGPLLLVGGLICFNRRRETQRTLSLVGALQGLFAMLLPTFLIGVCAGDEMLCKLLMQPALVFSGIVITGAGLLGWMLVGHEQPGLFSGKTRPA